MGEAIQEATGERIDHEINPEVSARRNALFDKYISPYKNMIYKLCIKYSDKSEDVEENYTIVLTTLFRGIETYDPSREIKTWIHIVTKRQVFEINRKRAQDDNRDRDHDVHAVCDNILDDDRISANCMCLENYRELYNDDILAALDAMKPMYKDALLLQMAGYSLQEIADIEFEKGNLSSRNIDTVKSRLFLARQYMRDKITRDGKRKTD